MPMGCRDRPFSVAVSYPPCTIEGIKMVKYGGNLLPGAGPCVLPAETPCGSLPVFGEFGMPTTGGDHHKPAHNRTLCDSLCSRVYHVEQGIVEEEGVKL